MKCRLFFKSWSRSERYRLGATTLRVWLCLLLIGVTAACAYGGRPDRPLVQKFTWFSFLNGDDIRRRCANVEDHWEVRLVYNGHYERQVRSYNLIGDGLGGAGVAARASPPGYGDISRISPADPLETWRWRTSRTRLDPRERRAFEAGLEASGVFGEAPAGETLKSWGWYWIAIVCRDGEIQFNAWTYPSERWSRQQLRELVEPYDETGVPFNAPDKPSLADRLARARGPGHEPDVHFRLEVGANGLRHLATPF